MFDTFAFFCLTEEDLFSEWLNPSESVELSEKVRWAFGGIDKPILAKRVPVFKLLVSRSSSIFDGRFEILRKNRKNL